MKKSIFLTFVALLGYLTCSATTTITKTTCNYQSGDAVVEHAIQVGWQL